MAKLRALTMLNECGDTTLVWTSDRDAEMEAIIEQKLAEGCLFYIIDPRFGTRERLTDARDANRHRMLAIPDEAFRTFVSGSSEPVALTGDSRPVAALPAPEAEPTAAAVPTPDKPARGARRAKSAKEVATSESVGVQPRRGG